MKRILSARHRDEVLEVWKEDEMIASLAILFPQRSRGQDCLDNEFERVLMGQTPLELKDHFDKVASNDVCMCKPER